MYVHRLTVAATDADELGHANNLSFLRWMLDAAAAHWDHLTRAAPPDAVAGIAWVVLRHQVDYLAAAFPGDEIEARTWVASCSAATSERRAEIVRARDGVTLARAASTYCPIDARTGRPRRIGPGLLAALGSPPVVKRSRSG